MSEGAGRHSRAWSVILVLILLAAVLVGARTTTGAATVGWLRGFLEFYSGAFALVATTAATVAGSVTALHVMPARFRILIQAAHRATALMAIAFLAAHILLKIMEAHANALDALMPFLGGQDRALYVGLGTIASDLLILGVATGVLRGRFAGHRRPWLWRAVHGLAYAMWPLAIAHGLLAGRTPKWWVTLSYLVCVGFVAVIVLARLPRMARERRLAGVRRGRSADAGVPGAGVSGAGVSGAGVPGAGARDADPRGRGAQGGGSPRAGTPAVEVPDEQFWRLLRAEAKEWIGERP